MRRPAATLWTVEDARAQLDQIARHNAQVTSWNIRGRTIAKLTMPARLKTLDLPFQIA